MNMDNSNPNLNPNRNSNSDIGADQTGIGFNKSDYYKIPNEIINRKSEICKLQKEQSLKLQRIINCLKQQKALEQRMKENKNNQSLIVDYFNKNNDDSKILETSSSVDSLFRGARYKNLGQKQKRLEKDLENKKKTIQRLDNILGSLQNKKKDFSEYLRKINKGQSEKEMLKTYGINNNNKKRSKTPLLKGSGRKIVSQKKEDSKNISQINNRQSLNNSRCQSPVIPIVQKRRNSNIFNVNDQNKNSQVNIKGLNNLLRYGLVGNVNNQKPNLVIKGDQVISFRPNSNQKRPVLKKI